MNDQPTQEQWDEIIYHHRLCPQIVTKMNVYDEWVFTQIWSSRADDVHIRRVYKAMIGN